MNKALLQKFTTRLKTLRKIKGMTQDDLSANANISHPTISMIESKRRDVTLNKIEKISKALKVEPKELFTFD